MVQCLPSTSKVLGSSTSTTENKISFLLLSNIPFNHLFADRNLECFQFLATTNIAGIELSYVIPYMNSAFVSLG